MAGTAERMKALRERRKAAGLREVRLVLPDARLEVTRRRISEQVARLDPVAEEDAMRWIESVSEFDEPK
ncbi:MAG: DUF3018 family protein [Phreatobacter sp.]|uniref:antitoxin MazE-like protein n=1 Tax=Phreatobacter sp. TaxID=1966341 RepID=UPI0027332C3B|nr:antitoxin MazE-like protein [Phreatobacter sp.]MDP2801752.1 DUF3018 family protein [Phreatobacter sp.]